ncbi:hypothetical protein RGI145_12395 [Roseomonas gilardii]|uniref:DNA primase/polymerase bifunctional N-terminal domain-containing protein n=1 Tax=Roseomonas gilardii TaxID=257708 RepID=A0A1L7AG91_9PROT|nr:hypothetical protein [Roseomonas gilardii]APT57793.1 hypothetical protein RGI145_12395 [Roseomonas gilardii]
MRAAPFVTIEQLSIYPQWVAWQEELRQGQEEPTKTPYSPVKWGRAKADDPQTWGTRAQALERLERLPKPYAAYGVGLEFAPLEVPGMAHLALSGVDLDCCRDKETGRIEEWAWEVIRRFNSYTEVSPSGTGVKTFFLHVTADWPLIEPALGPTSKNGRQFKRGTGRHPPAIELYLRARYFAVTGERLDEITNEIRVVPTDDILWVIQDAGPAFKAGGTRPEETIDMGFDIPPGGVFEDQPPPGGDDLMDRLAAAMKRRKKVAARWNGNTEGLEDTSRSGMDMSMMAMLRRVGFKFEECKTILLRWPHGAGSTKAGDDRYWLRMWERGAKPEDMARAETRANMPVIRVVKGSLSHIVDQAEQALIQAGLGLYQRGSMLVRPGIARLSAAKDEMTEAQEAMALGEMAMVEAMTTAAVWEKWDGRTDDWVVADAPKDIARIYMQRVGRWRLPVLAGIIASPTIRKDGSILATEGYDAKTGLLLEFRGQTFPPVPDRPTPQQAEAALQVLIHLIQTFPFEKPSHRSVMLSAILTAVARRSMDTAPLHGFSAHTAGSGKSMLVNIASMIATGQKAPVIAQGDKPEEFEKRLVSMLRQANAIISIDNVNHVLDGDLLNQMLTEPVVRGRILGVSEAPQLISNAFVAATGNNLVLGGDMTRRSLLCVIDPGVERPEHREFAQDPIALIRADRGRYVAAALTILRAYFVAGRPPKNKPLGSFVEWSRMVRDALCWLGEADPVETVEEVRAADPRLERLVAVLEQWSGVIGTAEVSTENVIQHATSQQTATDPEWIKTRREGSPPKMEFRHPEFRAALLRVGGERGAIDSEKLGKWLRSNKGRVANGFRIDNVAPPKKQARWKLEIIKEDQK